MKVENHNGVGNTNHDELGRFSSGGSGGSTPHKIMKNTLKVGDNRVTYKSNDGTLNKNQYNFLKKQNKLNEYKDKVGANKQNAPAKVDANLVPQTNSLKQNQDNLHFQDVMKQLSNTALAKTIKFVASGFDFNKFKSKGGKLNSKVFGKKANTNNGVAPAQPLPPQKVSDEEMQKLHQEGLQLQREANQINAEAEHFKMLRDTYAQKFGGANQKMFNNFLRKSNMFKKYLIVQDKQKDLKERQAAYNKKEQAIKDRIIANNQTVKQEG